MSIGGLLGPILAGLTGYAEQQRQAEQNRIRSQEAQMRQQMFQNYLKTQQDQQQAEGGFFSALSGLGGIEKPQPVGGGAGMPWEQASQLIKQYESHGGQNIEQQVLGPKGGYNPSTGTVTGPSSASGPYQMLDPTWRSAAKAAGIDASQYPRAISAPVELQEKAARGLYEREGFRPWAPYNKNLAAAIGRSGSTGPAQAATGAGSDLRARYDAGLARYGQTEGQYGPGHYNSEQGAGRRPAPETFEQYKARFADQGGSGSTGPAQPAAGAGDDDGGGGGDVVEGATAPMAQVEIPPEMQKEARQVEVKVAQAVDPMARGKMSLEGLARSIEKSMPNASPHAKFLALEKLQKFMAPLEQERRQQDMERMREQFRSEMERTRDRERNQMEDRREKMRMEQQDRQFRQQSEMLDKRQGATDDRADKRTRDQTERDERKSKEQEALVDKRAQAQGWEVREDKDGTQYRYNKLTGEATDLLGKKPYEPQAAAKVGTRPPSGDALMTDDEAKLAAEQYLAGDRTSIQGWGRGAQGDANRVKIRQQISGLAKEKGWKGADVAQAIAEFEGNKAGQRRLGTLEATLGTGLAEANIFAPMLLDASEKVDRTQFPTVNSILMAAERGTGDESVVRYSVAFNALVGAYSQVLTRNGVPTDKARETARETFNPALSKDQMRAVIDQVMLEIKGANKAPGIVRGEMRERAAPGGKPGAAPSGGTPAQSSGPPKAGVGEVVQGPDGKRYRVLSVTPTGEADEIEPAQ